MERPDELPISDETWLPNQFRYLLQRIHSLVEGTDDHATILVDGDASLQGNVARGFDSFLFRSGEGRSFARITDSPYFVDSRTTLGIQIADMFAGVLRLWEENGLHRDPPPDDAFLSAIRRYYGIVEELSKDAIHEEHGVLPGIYRMPEHAHLPSRPPTDPR